MSPDLKTLARLSFPEALDRLGNFHDATVMLVEWQPEERLIRLFIDDILANFERTTDHSAGIPGAVELLEVEAPPDDLSAWTHGLWLLDVSARPSAKGFVVDIEANAGSQGSYIHATLFCRDCRLTFAAPSDS